MYTPFEALMVQGTTSDAGKSVLVAGLCRVLARKGIKVAPFKPQNMALNSAVTSDGGEIGRAQAVQAQACNVEPTVHMNPILLKPNSDTGAQVIIQGRALSNMEATSYHDYKQVAMDSVIDSFGRLKSDFESVMIEGAGSPAEINLRAHDIANMGFAEKADVPVIIVADIDRGGVFAHLVGTLDLLSPTEQARVKGFVINRFRGDIKLLESGLDWLEERTGKPVIGVIPFLHGLNLEAEDAITADQIKSDDTLFKVKVPVVTRISNHTDFDPLRLNPSIDFEYVRKGGSLQGADLIILPGTKSVRADLAFLREQGWDKDIQRHLRFGGKVMGICGGYQMLGKVIDDPEGIEGPAGSSQGLACLDLATVLQSEKQLKQVTGKLTLNQKTVAVKGYEIHAGVTTVNEQQPIQLGDDKSADGAISDCNQIFGTYLHGVFELADASELIMTWAGSTKLEKVDFEKMKEEGIDRIADALEESLDLNKLWPEIYA